MHPIGVEQLHWWKIWQGSLVFHVFTRTDWGTVSKLFHSVPPIWRSHLKEGKCHLPRMKRQLNLDIFYIYFIHIFLMANFTNWQTITWNPRTNHGLPASDRPDYYLKAKTNYPKFFFDLFLLQGLPIGKTLFYLRKLIRYFSSKSWIARY